MKNSNIQKMKKSCIDKSLKTPSRSFQHQMVSKIMKFITGNNQHLSTIILLQQCFHQKWRIMVVIHLQKSIVVLTEALNPPKSLLDPKIRQIGFRKFKMMLIIVHTPQMTSTILRIEQVRTAQATTVHRKTRSKGREAFGIKTLRLWWCLKTVANISTQAALAQVAY